MKKETRGRKPVNDKRVVFCFTAHASVLTKNIKRYRGKKALKQFLEQILVANVD